MFTVVKFIAHLKQRGLPLFTLSGRIKKKSDTINQGSPTFLPIELYLCKKKNAKELLLLQRLLCIYVTLVEFTLESSQKRFFNTFKGMTSLHLTEQYDLPPYWIMSIMLV